MTKRLHKKLPITSFCVTAIHSSDFIIAIHLTLFTILQWMKCHCSGKLRKDCNIVNTTMLQYFSLGFLKRRTRVIEIFYLTNLWKITNMLVNNQRFWKVLRFLEPYPFYPKNVLMFQFHNLGSFICRRIWSQRRITWYTNLTRKRVQKLFWYIFTC